MQIEVIAHRGYSSAAPENTLAALSAAVDAGADAVEFDLHVASCGTPVLFHDVHLGRTTNGVGPVRRRTLAQLQALDAGRWFSPDFEGERIPSLAEALELLAPAELPVYAEVKGYRELEDLDRMARIVAAAGMSDRVRFISMDYGIIDRIGGQDAGVGLGWIVEQEDRFVEAMQRANAASSRALIDFDYRVLLADPDLAPRTRARGVELAVWTVDDTADADALYDLGVRRITTNRVSELREWASTKE